MSEAPRDDILIARCLENDVDAWRTLVGRYTSYMYTIVIRGFGIADEEAREVVQDSLLKLFEGLRGYRGEGEFRAWLRQIVRNCSVAYLQRRRTTESLDETLRDPHQEETSERIERAFVLSGDVRGLDEPLPADYFTLLLSGTALQRNQRRAGDP
jgi:RNA polymerase sigma factor (sigma-70 family)